jgi:hypothetical protein
VSGSSKYFWPCACMEKWWQEKFNPPLERCTVCQQVARFFEMTKEQQAEEVKKLYQARIGISGWLAVHENDGGMVSMPREIASKSAGWT